MKIANPGSQPPLQGFLIATKRVAEEEHKVCFMYREAPMDVQDSGWRLFAGDETQEYVDDPDNSGIYQPAAILMVDDSIGPLLAEPIGSAFEREDGTAAWRVADGFDFGHDDAVEAQQLGGGWHIEISGAFDRYEEEEGDTVFATNGRTARVAIWDFSDKEHAEVVVLHRDFIRNRDQSEAPTLEDMGSEADGIVRMGFVVEEADESHRYHVLYGYTIIGGEVAQGAYYYDDPADKAWAVETWHSVSMA